LIEIDALVLIIKTVLTDNLPVPLLPEQWRLTNDGGMENGVAEAMNVGCG
jgi:hypothetical protein